MKRLIPIIRCLIVLLLSAIVTGCGPTAYKITPVPVDRKLTESVLIDEGGLFPAKIVLIDVDGLLHNSRGFSLFEEGENPVSLFTEKLDKAIADSGAKALIVRINSPGGTVTASDLMYTELQRFKEQTEGQRPVVAVLMDVAASGGYYVACGADEIVAHPTTVTGSVGVIMQMINFAGTMSKIGVESNAITSGVMKDAGSPFRKMKPEEREVFQKLVDQFFDRFVKVVADSREKLDETKVRELADGRVWSAQQALELNFADKIGTLRDAIHGIKEKINAPRVRVVTYHRPMGWKPNLYARQSAGEPQVNLVNIDLPESWPYPQPQFLYLWAPGQ